MHGYLRFEPRAWKWNEELPCLCADCKILISLILFKFSRSLLDWTALSWNFGGIFSNIVRGVCGHCHLQGFYNESALFLLTVVWPQAQHVRRDQSEVCAGLHPDASSPGGPGRRLSWRGRQPLDRRGNGSNRLPHGGNNYVVTFQMSLATSSQILSDMCFHPKYMYCLLSVFFYFYYFNFK